MRRDYGSRLFELVDKPINRDLTLEIYSAVAKALQRWEERFKLKKVKMTEVKEGKVTLELEGLYLYQFSLLMNQIRSIAELFNCGRGKRGNKFTQSALKQNNCIVDLIA